MKYDYIIAIDPDTEKSGFCYLKMKEHKIEARSVSFPELMDYLHGLKQKNIPGNVSLIVIVEAGWLNKKSNFGGYKRSGTKSAGERIAKNVGANHETGKKIIEMCRHYGIPVEEKRPLKKIWKGPDGKITQEELAYFTGIDGRMGQDTRDAILLAWDYAGLPMKMKV